MWSNKYILIIWFNMCQSVKVNTEADNYGGEAIINVWNMHVEPSESSCGAIFVGRRDNSDAISAGWMVLSLSLSLSRNVLYV